MVMPQHVNIDAWHTLNGFRHSRAHIAPMHKKKAMATCAP